MVELAFVADLPYPVFMAAFVVGFAVAAMTVTAAGIALHRRLNRPHGEHDLGLASERTGVLASYARTMSGLWWLSYVIAVLSSLAVLERTFSQDWGGVAFGSVVAVVAALQGTLLRSSAARHPSRE